VIEAFQRERKFNVLIHVQNVMEYMHQKTKEEEHFPTQPAIRSLMQELLAKDNVLEENQEVPQFNKGINPNSIINLDDFSQSFGPSNPLLCPAFINLGTDFDFTTPMKPKTNPTHGANNTCPTHATITIFGNIKVKRKRSLTFSCLSLNPLIKIAR